MAAANVLPGAQSVSEWGATWRGFIVACGEAAALAAAHITNGAQVSTSQLQGLLNRAGSQGQLSGAGFGQTAPNVQWDLTQLGVQSQVTYGSSGLAQRLNSSLAAGTPVVLGVSNGGALSEEPGSLQGHYVTVVGRDSFGNYITADPNAPVAQKGGFTTNTLGQLLQASPFAQIIPTGSLGGSVSQAGQTAANTAQQATSSVTSGPFNINITMPNLLQTLLSGLQVPSLTDLAWRAGLIVAGLLLVIVGIVLFFAHTNVGMVTQVASSQPAKQAAKDVAK